VTEAERDAVQAARRDERDAVQAAKRDERDAVQAAKRDERDAVQAARRDAACLRHQLILFVTHGTWGAGIKVGCVLEAINGVSLAGLTSEQVCVRLAHVPSALRLAHVPSCTSLH
jgi:hypothetical protein